LTRLQLSPLAVAMDEVRTRSGFRLLLHPGSGLGCAIPKPGRPSCPGLADMRRIPASFQPRWTRPCPRSDTLLPPPGFTQPVRDRRSNVPTLYTVIMARYFVEVADTNTSIPLTGFSTLMRSLSQEHADPNVSSAWEVQALDGRSLFGRVCGSGRSKTGSRIDSLP
jgi:hypothetical protein